VTSITFVIATPQRQMNRSDSRSLQRTRSRPEGAFSQRLSVGWEPSATPLLIGDDLQQRIVAQTIGVFGILVSRNGLIDALPQQHRRIVLHALRLTPVAEAFGPVPSQMMALIEGAQGQQTGVAGDLAAGKIGADRLMTVEGEGQLWHCVSSDGCSEKGMLGVQTQCSSFLLEHPFFR